MQIIFRQNDDGVWCLFDTRSNQFFPGSAVRSIERSRDSLEIANAVVSRSSKTILEMALSPQYDNGYFEWQIASNYLKMNPDIRDRVVEKLNKPKVNKKMTRIPKVRKKREEKPKREKLIKSEESKSTSEEVKSTTEVIQKRGRGRPRKVL